MHFCDDVEKMYDFARLTKDEFLDSYSYLNAEEYEATKAAWDGIAPTMTDVRNYRIKYYGVDIDED